MSTRNKFNFGVPADESALADALHEIINGDDSDLEIDIGDEDVAEDPPYVPTGDGDEDESSENGSEEEDVQGNDVVLGSNSCQSSQVQPPLVGNISQRRVYWKSTNVFEPLPPAPNFKEPERVVINLPPHDYFTKYIPSDIYERIAFHSNQTYLAKTGTSLNTSEKEIRTFFGITLMMSYLRFPRIRMYWEKKSRIFAIADRMARDRYFKLRASLKVLTDADVPDSEKQKTKFWKVLPLISCIRNGCLMNVPTSNVCVDEQMIPFWGKHAARQMIRSKPNPVGLKNFVLACPNGLPLDFFIYEGKGDTILDDDRVQALDIGGKVVFRLCNRLPPGCCIFMDRYFTSINLLEMLHFVSESTGTGTLQKNRIPSNCNFKTDAQLRRQGRGSYCQQVLSTGQVAAVKWFDNKPVHLASSVHGAEPTDECRRWDKNHKRYINVPRPAVVKEYNENMGGVDYLDHCLGFREQIAEYLLENDAENEEDPPLNDATTIARQSKRARTEHPTDFVRTKGVDHLPLVLGSQNRCRLPGCKSTKARHQCPTCKVILCLMAGRNCYKDYHEK
ncbi:piggyBac transposable element-derived protein 3-like [Hyposmocoma kahamanoa]|uniref:piggyBac transposable element-derived protein 3-like n=1 Tax=Hyposmocoma kahamanoa TaxID=1477025 RepID=UPI000E6D8F3A|nr:piggyBac transposable element-derived protein 3-like [Hyposmocoma kahamanoa]